MGIISLILSLYLLNSIPSDSCQYICWNENRELNWDDFQGSIPNSTSLEGYYAITSGDIQVLTIVRSEIPEFIIKVRFSKNRSWTKGNSKELLKHEQTHFDIVELYARKVRSSIGSLQQRDITSREIYTAEIADLIKQKNIRQDDFDQETRFGNNSEAQERWELRLQKELTNLSNYKSELEECECEDRNKAPNSTYHPWGCICNRKVREF